MKLLPLGNRMSKAFHREVSACHDFHFNANSGEGNRGRMPDSRSPGLQPATRGRSRGRAGRLQLVVVRKPGKRSGMKGPVAQPRNLDESIKRG